MCKERDEEEKVTCYHCENDFPEDKVRYNVFEDVPDAFCAECADALIDDWNNLSEQDKKSFG